MLCFLIQEFYSKYQTSNPAIYASVIVLAFVVMTVLFFTYDWVVTKRQNKTIQTAVRTQAIVQSLFPKEMGKKLIAEANEQADKKTNLSGKAGLVSAMHKGGELDLNNKASKPLADLFPEATVMFADMVGFTAWSSTREPTQVFTLLETVYGAFDDIAHKRRVFKVETVGDW